MKQVYQIAVEYTPSETNNTKIAEIVKNELESNYKCKILRFQTRRKEECIRLEVMVRTAKGSELMQLAKLVEKYSEIEKISI